ncbi:MAG: hypothetical protein LBL66_01420 [Clostridiales bacterium]|jgi:hypothetical protein|nr:hypothetical protein [Clostridiales bacterium]
MKMNVAVKAFLNPPREYGVYPIIHGDISRWRELLPLHEECGFAGVAANPEWNNAYPRDGAAWERYAEGFAAYARMGMKQWMYDEHGYPSGTAGGAVLEKHPEYEALELLCFERGCESECRIELPDGRLFRAYAISDGGAAADITGGADGRGVLRFTAETAWLEGGESGLSSAPKPRFRLAAYLVRRSYDSTHAAANLWGARRQIDMMDKRAARAFVGLTHEKFKAAAGSGFNGRNVKGFFTDEPALNGWNMDAGSYRKIPWSDALPPAFEERYGYDIGLALNALFAEGGAAAVKRRCDFWDLVADLTAEGYFGVIREWCRENGVKSSGHMLCEEEALAHVPCYGSLYRCAKFFDIPGVDQLKTDPAELLDRPEYPAILPIARLVSSVADLYGDGEAFTEISQHVMACQNKLPPIEWIRAQINWHLALGVNNIASYHHVSAYEPQEWRALNEYTARIGAALRAGARDARTAVLYPENSLWTLYRPGRMPTWSEGADQSARALECQTAVSQVSWELLHRQIDFDYIDEGEIARAAVKGKRLCVRNRRYECVVLPYAHVMNGESVGRLCAFMRAGGRVVAVGASPEIARETGERADFAVRFAPFAARGDFLFVRADEFARAAGLFPRSIRLLPAGAVLGGDIAEKNILAHVRRDGGGLTVFLCNMGASPYTGELVADGFLSAARGDPSDGSLTEFPAPFPGVLKPYTGRLLFLHA